MTMIAQMRLYGDISSFRSNYSWNAYFEDLFLSRRIFKRIRVPFEFELNRNLFMVRSCTDIIGVRHQVIFLSKLFLEYI